MPVTRTLVCTALIALFAPYTTAGTLSVSADFDNGRVAVRSIDQERRIIRTTLPPDNHTHIGGMRHWHFRIDGIIPGEWITIDHTPRVNVHCVYSYDGENWHRFPEPGNDGLRFRFIEPSVYIAPSIPYPYARAVAFADRMGELAAVERSALAVSEGGREVPLLRITDPATPDDGKRIVWMMGRQHAFESPSSYVVEGFAEWMASDDPAAREFRRSVIAYAIPVMDVDNVFRGMSGKDQPNDFNRVWHMESPPWNAVREARTRMLQLRKTHNFLALIDSHSPLYNHGPHWYISTPDPPWSDFAEFFQDGIREAGDANWHSNRVVSHDPDPETTHLARNFAAVHLRTDDDFIAATPETAHHRDSRGEFMTVGGFRQWGEAMGRALYKLTGGTETPVNTPPRARFERRSDGTFDASASAAANGSITEYRWDFGDGTARTTENPQVRHEFSAFGHFPVSLVVVDSNGVESPAVSLTVHNGEPPPTPVQLRAAPPATDAGAVKVAWSFSHDDKADFELERMDAQGEWEPLASAGAGVRSYHDATSPRGAGIRYRLRSVNVFGTSDWTSPVAVKIPALDEGRSVTFVRSGESAPRAHADAYIREGRPDTAHGDNNLLVGTHPARHAGEMRAVFSFDISSETSPNALIDGVALYLTVTPGGADSITIDLYKLTPANDPANRLVPAAATWHHFAEDRPWKLPGGDFDRGNPLATATIDSNGAGPGKQVIYSGSAALAEAARRAHRQNRPLQLIIVPRRDGLRSNALARFAGSAAGNPEERPLLVVAVKQPAESGDSRSP